MPDNVVVTPHQETPRQAAQTAEGNAREAAGTNVPANETTIATQPTETDAGPQDPGAPAPAPAAQAAEPETKAAPPVKGLFDDKRAAIINGWRTDRDKTEANDTNDVLDFTRSSGLPPEWQPELDSAPAPAPAPAPEPQPEPADAQQPAPAAQQPDAAAEQARPAEAPKLPPKVTLTVNGETKEFTLEEALAKAQIAVASEDMLDTAKSRLKQVDALLADVSNRAARPAPSGTPTDENLTQPGTDPNDPALAHQQDGKRLTELFQFGDPDEAETALQHTIASRATQIVQQQLLQNDISKDAAKAQAVLKDFSDRHPEIAGDPRAKAVIEEILYEHQAQDLKAIGIDPTRRPDGNPATPQDIANLHQHARAKGLAVRPVSDLLTKATDDYMAWKGISNKPSDPTPAPATPPAPPRAVEVVVDRAVRRQTIPQQPSQTAAPRAAPAEPAAPRDRSAIVNAMKVQRNVPRNRVVA